jgi:hypothetical protein
MPWTFSHPAAVLLFKRWCPRYLSLPALAIGSVAPDFGYYINRYDLSDLAHTWAGVVLADVPTGLLVMVLFYLLRKPLWFLLPEPHRSAFAPRLARPPSVSVAFVIGASVSIALGACTHIVWDSFTHPYGWVVRQIAALRAPWFSIGTITAPGYSILQHASTLVGFLILAAAYVGWLRRQPRDPSEARAGCEAGSDRWRYLLAIGAAIASLAIAIPLALTAAAANQSSRSPLSVFVVQAAIYGASVFAVLILVTSLSTLCLLRLRRRM